MRSLLCLLVLMTSFSAAAQVLPPEAEAIVVAYEKKAAAIREKAERETQPHTTQAIAALQALQDAYCKKAKLDEAVAIRDRIRALRGVLPDPGALSVQASDLGKTFLFEVTGTTTGSVWGTEVYTSDTHLGAAAVHQGLLKPGERDVLKVTVIAGQSAYLGTTKNGVTSQGYGAWSVSFVIGKPTTGKVDAAPEPAKQ
ncbi:MAG: LCCL domain-containing protein [Myxococcales bacterium]|nr:LCCL domain-containing protein [Myxococcales bacterium]